MTTNAKKITTAGSLWIKSQMPTPEAKAAYDPYKVLDKKGMSSMINTLLSKGGDNAHETINDLGKIFFSKSTEIGASTPLSDYINDSDERQALIQEFSHKVQDIKNSGKSKAEINKNLGDLTSKYNTKIEDQNLSYLVNKGSTAANMARFGARGNKSQLANATSSPLMSLNIKGELVPLVIKHGFAEGMTPAEHLALSYMGRASTVLSQLSTALPGALFKRISPTLFNEVITIQDCGTTNGIMVPISDKKSLIGRFQAGTNSLMDERYYDDLRSSNVKEVKVRSTTTCEAPEGTCVKCFGLAANGKLPEIGENIGVIAAQSVSEVLTQSMLSTKHKSSVGERRGNAYDQASNILNNPAENFKDEATISELNGVVSKIEKTPLGDTNVFINEKKHFVPISQNVVVSQGDKIRQGDRLSTGVINPRKLVGLRGIGAGRDYMTQELRGIYGADLDPRWFEVISKNLIKYVQVVNPGQSGFLPGDKIPVNNVAKYLAHNNGIVPISQAEGKVLAKGVLSLTPGTFLDSNHVDELKAKGIKEVAVSSSGLTVSPIVPGLQSTKLLDKDWISRLSFNKLKDSILNAAAYSEDSPEHSTSPITPYIIGRDFGSGPEGQY